MQRDGFFRRWLAGVYANRVHARIDAFITHSIGFNAPLAPGLRRFAADWCEVGRAIFRERVRRLLHLAAILAAAGLMAGYDIRGWLLRQAAGWSNGVLGPTSAHTGLVTLYGSACKVSGVRIPSAHDLLALAWTGPATGGGPAGQWLYLIDWTALLSRRAAARDRGDPHHAEHLAPRHNPADTAVVRGISRRRAALADHARNPARPNQRLSSPADSALPGRALQKSEAAAARIQAHAHAERHGLVLNAMTYRESRRAGKARRGGQLAQHVGAGVIHILVLTARELPKGDAAHPTEHPGERKMGPHAVQTVRTLANVLEQQDGALERRKEGRTEKPGQHREVTAEERPLHSAGDECFPTDQLGGRRI